MLRNVVKMVEAVPCFAVYIRLSDYEIVHRCLGKVETTPDSPLLRQGKPFRVHSVYSGLA